ncbi:MAG: hypothetical protein AB7V50_11540 [Vampirovibrionia bacterium]
MGEIISFKKLDYSTEAEEVTQKVITLAFKPLKIVSCLLLVSFGLYFLLGYGNVLSFVNTYVFKYFQLALIVCVFWLVLQLRFGLKCPGCGKSFFKFSRKIQVKPHICQHCNAIFVKKTHPIEDEFDYSGEFYLLKIEIDRRVDLSLFYIVAGIFIFFYLIFPVITGILGPSFTMFVVFPVVLVLSAIYIMKQLETRCPSCSGLIKWTELRPTEVSKCCPHCNVNLVK